MSFEIPKYSSMFIPVCYANSVTVCDIIAIESIRKFSINGNGIEIDTWDGSHYRADDHEGWLFKKLIKRFNEINGKL